MNKFDQAAQAWDEKPGRIEMAEKTALEISSRLPEDTSGSALDFGCGTGLLSFLLADKFAEIAAIDSSSGMIDVFKEKLSSGNYAHITPYCLDIVTDKICLSEINVVFTAMALHHVQNVSAVLKNCCSIMAPGSVFYWIDLIEEDGSFHSADEEIGHKGFSQEDVEAYFSGAGFELVEYSIFHKLNREINSGEFRDFPLFIATGRKLND